LMPLALILRGTGSGYFAMGFLGPKAAVSVLAHTGILKALAAVLPLFFIFAAGWLKAYKTAVDKRLRRILLLCMLEPFFIFAVSIFFYYAVSDGWKYYVSAVLLTQFCMLFYFLNAREKTVTDAFAKFAGFFEKNLLVLLAVLIYLVKAPLLFYAA
jgi:hypothetical protein